MTERPEHTVGPLFLAGFEGAEPSAEIEALIRDYRIGGVILYARNCVDTDQVRELTNNLQKTAREAGHDQPLLVAIDQEQGRVVRLTEGVTLFPAMGEIARLGDPSLVGRVAETVARELRAVGVTWNLAPVADVLSVPSCPVGTRSFGSDPETVGEMVAAYVGGAEEGGGIACLKHFPGHGGTEADSHFASPRIDRGAGDLEAVDLAPFRAGIAAGAPTVMTTHITFPALDDSLPATFSPKVIDGLLRDGLGFRGTVVSDDLEMAGAAERFTLGEAALLTLRAGVDVILVSRMLLAERDIPGVIEDVARAFREGAIPAEKVVTARGRIRALKERFVGTTWFRSREEAAPLLRPAAHLALLEQVKTGLSKEAPHAEG